MKIVNQDAEPLDVGVPLQSVQMKEVESVDRCKWAPERFCSWKFEDFMKEIQRLKTNLRPKMLSQTNTTMQN